MPAPAKAKATAPQLRKLFCLARELGMDHEDLRGLAYNMAGVDGLSQLTRRDAMRLIDYLVDRSRKDYRPTAASRQQIYLIEKLAAELGWNDNPRRLAGFVRRTAGVAHMRWLDAAGAYRVIEGLKKMVERRKKNPVQQPVSEV
ncbi:regulatory protein GemA [Desulfofundulus thermosubterraneus]|uniref:Mu-like prophage protein gp16 n=1 Tax=Desulfofundulus thermosubterraneus DSM 16057 TaxID=1121432 RepID=A0A1M6KLJ5_9FIRM|nr:regulatory protein GemA [Desulfofundulus thermosubterraneus]SHJ59843.1 Protein of unknown function [Desulfofundulus thermosubterraneus DSM 16057]